MASTQMNLDGFHRRGAGLRAPGCHRGSDRLFDIVEWVSRRLRVEVSGIENLPRGRALLVANHAFGWDIYSP